METTNQSDKNKEVSEQKTQSSDAISTVSPISFFRKDKNFIFVHQKTEKLVSAIFILTNFLPNEESLKWSLRNLGSTLLKLTIDLKQESFMSSGNTQSSLSDTILEIASLLEVAQFAGLISAMNVTILHREFHGYFHLFEIWYKPKSKKEYSLLKR